MSEPVTAVALDPNELLLEGTVEIRPCRVCRIRLTTTSGNLGKLVACPGCGCAERALAAEGPFVTVAQPLVPLEVVDRTGSTEPTAAPVMPYRRLDPFDDCSPMVDAVGQLLWVSAAFLVVGAIYSAASFWKRAEGEEMAVYAAAAVRLVVAGLNVLASGGVTARHGWGWWLGILSSLGVLAVGGWTLRERTVRPGHAAGQFDFAVLLEMPSLLIGVFALVVLVAPRYAAEFRRPAGQAGTM
jgi:hypothetical protein